MIREINRLASRRIPFLLLVDFEMKKPLIFPLDTLPPDIYFSVPEASGILPDGAAKNPADHSSDKIEFLAEPIPYSRYKKAFELIRENALLGKTFLTNLTFPTRIRSNLSLEDIFDRSKAMYKLLFKDQFVVFSPEIFVRIRDGQIRSFPMKGTIDADMPGAEEILLNDRKETAEHVTIVDLIRNDLSIHGMEVRVEKFRYLDLLETSHKKLLQVSSVISGKLPGDYLSRLGDILFSMLPAGSVSGAPKPQTIKIIREAEGSDRGYYTGIMGYFDGRDFDSCVLIRFIEKRRDGLYYRSGGGITFLSEPEKEYQELIDKVYVPIA
jgi:para-aminobenzoate synthetase component 1